MIWKCITYCGGYMNNISPIVLSETAGSPAHSIPKDAPTTCPPEQPNCPQTNGLAPESAIKIQNKSWIA